MNFTDLIIKSLAENHISHTRFGKMLGRSQSWRSNFFRYRSSIPSDIDAIHDMITKAGAIKDSDEYIALMRQRAMDFIPQDFLPFLDIEAWVFPICNNKNFADLIIEAIAENHISHIDFGKMLGRPQSWTSNFFRYKSSIPTNANGVYEMVIKAGIAKNSSRCLSLMRQRVMDFIPDDFLPFLDPKIELINCNGAQKVNSPTDHIKELRANNNKKTATINKLKPSVDTGDWFRVDPRNIPPFEVVGLSDKSTMVGRINKSNNGGIELDSSYCKDSRLVDVTHYKHTKHPVSNSETKQE